MVVRMLRRLAAGAALFLIACSGGDGLGPDQNSARIISFRAEPTRVPAGSAATLIWETEGALGVAIEPTVGLQPPSGSVEVHPIATTSYTLSIRSNGETVSSQVTIEVEGGPPRIESFTATPRTVQPGESALLEWTTINATRVRIEPDVGDQAVNGSAMVSPEVTTTYRLIATGDVGTAAQEVTVVVASGNQPFIRSFTATPQSVAAGAEVTLEWETLNTDSVTINPDVGAQSANGSVIVTPAQTTVYTLSAVGPGGNGSASVTVNVAMSGDPRILLFTVTPSTIAPGGTARLAWETDNATGVRIDPGIGAQQAKDQIDVSPTDTTTYILTAIGTDSEITAEVTLTVADPNAPLVTSFTAQPQAIVEGGSTTLTWTTQNADTVDIEPGVGTGLNANGSIQVSPTQTQTYTLTANGANGEATATLQITVSPAPPQVNSFTAQPASIVAGQMATLSWQTVGATEVTIDNGIGVQPPNGSVMVSPAQNAQYLLTATGPGGQTTAMVSVNVTQQGAPVIDSFTATPQQTPPGGQVTLAWQTTGATAVRIDNGIGVVMVDGNVVVTPNTTTTYTLSADGPGGATNAQVTVTVASPNGDQCSSPFEINQSGTFTGNTQTAVNDYSDSQACTGYASAGPDQVYRVSLQPNDRIRATLTPTNNWDASIYLVTGCGNISQSCVAGEDNGNPEVVDYVAANGGTFYLIVDGFGNAGGAYSLQVQIMPAPVGNDQCSGAVDVGRGGTFMSTTRFAQNDYDPGANGCTRYAEASRDLTYRVALAQGERLQATLNAAWDSALYVVTNCAMAAATCVAGSDRGNPEQIDFTAPSAGTYYLIVDGYLTASGDFTLTVSVSPPAVGGETCGNPIAVPAGGGSFVSTTANLMNDYDPPLACTGYPQAGPDRVYAVTVGRGDVIEAVAEFDPALDGALYMVTNCSMLSSCTAGSDQGFAGADEEIRAVAQQAGTQYLIVDANETAWSGPHELTVATYTGETCAAAAPLRLDSQPEFMVTTGRMNDYSPNSGGCTGYSASGEDRVYSVSLRAGDQLQADLDPDTGYDASLYLVSNCADVNGSCVAGSDRTGNVVESLSAVVQQAGTYYLIADGFAGSDGTGTITASIAHGDTCIDAYRVPAAGGTFRGTTTGYAANYGITTSAGSCTSWPQSGSDAVYQVSLNAGQRLQASLTTTWDAALYLITDCAQSATTCVAGRDSGNPETIDFTNSGTARRTYYLVVDSWRAGATTSGNYTLTVTIQ